MRSLRSFSLPALAALALCAPELRAQTPLWKLSGTLGDRAGWAVAPAGDFDADGRADLLLCAPLAKDGGVQAGRAEIRSGATGLVLWSRLGGSALDQLGSSAAQTGDQDGDQKPDFVLGAPGGSANGASSGYAEAFSGATGALLWTVLGSAPEERMGHAVGDAGDFDGDGRADFVCGAPGFDGVAGVDAGRAVVVSGRTGAPIASFQGHALRDGFGCAVAGVGDLDLDGFDDVAIGADQGSAGAVGYVEVRSGRTHLVLYTFPGLASGDLMGSAVAAAGDVNGDGRLDVAAGSPGAQAAGVPGAGRVEVFSGATGLSILSVAGLPGASLGQSLAGIGDVDGDGKDDLLAGAPLETGTGAARVLSGAGGAALVVHRGENPGDRFGWSVAAAGLVDLDLALDYAVGAPRDDDGGIDSGVGFVLDGTDDPPLPPFAYCTGKLNSAGCAALVAYAGAPSATLPVPFDVSASLVLNQKPGVLFFGSGQAQIAFLGGTLCVQPPLGRSKILFSGGSAGAPDCSGVLVFDMNVKIQNGSAPQLVPGLVVDAQFWYRDPGVSFAVSLSNALEFEIGP